MSQQTIIGIAQMKISSVETDVLVAPNLGSCVGVSIYDPVKKIGGLIHCLLPLSKSDPDKAAATPCMYVDTGVTKLLQDMFARGCNQKDLVIVAAGGSNINDANNVFEIGKKNHTILKKLLWKNNLLLKGEHFGDSISRTVTLNLQNGKTSVKFNGEVLQLG
jgi:chemotaxis protein CheD